MQNILEKLTTKEAPKPSYVFTYKRKRTKTDRRAVGLGDWFRSKAVRPRAEGSQEPRRDWNRPTGTSSTSAGQAAAVRLRSPLAGDSGRGWGVDPP